MATRVLAQVLVAGATVLVRAATQAWHQALANAQRTGVAQEAVNKATSKVTSSLSLQEAQLILGVEAGQTWEQVMKRYKHLFEVNEKHGSFYLVSKVYRAKERLEEEYREMGIKTDDPPSGPSAGEQQQQQQASGSERQQQDGR